MEGKEFQVSAAEGQKAWSACCFLLKVGMRKVLSSEEERRETYVRRSWLDVRFVDVPQLNPCDSTMLDEKVACATVSPQMSYTQSKILSTTLYIQLSIHGSVIPTTLIVYKASVICHYVHTLVHTKQDFIHHSLHTVVHTSFSDTHHSYCIQGKCI